MLFALAALTASFLLAGFRFRHEIMHSLIHREIPGKKVMTAGKNSELVLDKTLRANQLQPGDPIFIRIFKESKELEMWMRPSRSTKYVHVKTYPIANYGYGDLGPKLAEGDGQAPTGFYEVGRSQLNPNSDFHLSFNLGFPNAFDRARGRTGTFLMVHGDTASIGCYAMTDKLIEEIYHLADSALAAGQEKFSVHAFPFRMTKERLAKESDNPWHEEWQNLKKGYDLFERAHVPPRVTGSKSGYSFSAK